MKIIEKTDKPVLQSFADKQKIKFRDAFLYVSCILIFVCCFLLIGFAAQHVMRPLPHSVLPLSADFMSLGAWLPVSGSHAVLPVASHIEMFIFILLAFAVYAFVALLIQRQAPTTSMRGVTIFTWWGAVVVGLVLVCMPVLLSQDLFVYADYGHMLVAYGANPFFVPPATISHDTITRVDNWSFATSAYGPVWMYICALVALVGGDHPEYYYFMFRVFALACYLLNCLLISNILRATGCSPRTRALATLLYAWNPLVLLESCLGAHNDVLVNTLMLLSIYLALRAERKDFTRLRNYYGPLLVCSLAVLVKFTMLPLVVLFLLLLGCKTLVQDVGSLGSLGNWRARFGVALGNVCLAGVVFATFAFVCYLPLWFGHSIPEIVKSFATPPSAWWAENSLLRTIQEWLKSNGSPDPSSPFSVPVSLLSRRIVWDRISTVALACSLLMGAVYIWRKPTVYRMVVVLLASLCVLLVVTPWFYPWYVQWLMVLAVVLLAHPLQRFGKVLLAFTLTFSASAMTIYLDPALAPFGPSLDTRILINIGVPLLVALLTFWMAKDHNKLLPVMQDVAAVNKQLQLHPSSSLISDRGSQNI
jgi:hypothetical protein